jgi:VCBS repeat-containing protein
MFLAKYGSWSVDANGAWSYLLDNMNTSVQALGTGKTLIDSFVVTSLDGSATKTVSITIKGTNDIPVISGTTTGSVTEDKTYKATGTVVVSDTDSGEGHTKVTTSAISAHGTWSVDANGNWSYQLNNSDPAVQALGAGSMLSDSFVLQSQDGSASQIVTITVTGTNDVPVITGQTTGNVVEDGAVTASGTVLITDVDTGQSHSQAASGAAKYGTWSVDADGHWTYQLNNANTSVQALSAGKTLVDSFTVTSQDGSAHKTVSVTITGSNDLATMGGLASGKVTETTAMSVTGGLWVKDVDSGEAHTKVATNVAATFGHWSVDANGHWTYQLDQFNPAVMALPIGQSLSDSFTVQSQDGSASKLVTITIAGNNHVPVITGSVSGDVTEGVITSTSGTLTVTDSDTGQSHTQAGGGSAKYGSWAVDGDGHWSYQLDAAKAPVLGTGQTATDSFTVASLDGTASKLVTITIAGGNHAASISGTTTGAVAEDGTLSATGTLTVADADAGQAHSQVASNLVTSYGHWSVDADGHWSYQLDNTNATVQALGAGQTLIDSFTVTSQDGSASQLVSITISGTNDVAVVTGTVIGAVAEDGVLSATGTVVVTDADAGQAHMLVASNVASTYGHWSVDADGHWSYQLDNANAAVQALGAGQTLGDSFAVTSQDGSASKTVNITITGSNDVAVISGTVTGAVTEDGTLSATGTVVVSDADSGQAHTQVVNNAATTYGHWSVDANGKWSYLLDNTKVQSLAPIP